VVELLLAEEHVEVLIVQHLYLLPEVVVQQDVVALPMLLSQPLEVLVVQAETHLHLLVLVLMVVVAVLFLFVVHLQHLWVKNYPLSP